MPCKLDLILSLALFRDAFDALVTADAVNGAAIEKAIRSALDEPHHGLERTAGSPDLRRYWLYRSQVEVKAQASAALNYERMMAQREANLWRFALESNDVLMTHLFDGIDRYFTGKADTIIAEIEGNARWYTDLGDYVKQTGRVPKKIGEIVGLGLGAAKGSERLGKRVRGVIGKADALVGRVAGIDVRSILEKAIETHLSAAILEKDLRAILSEGAEIHQKGWGEQIRAQSPDARELRVFSGVSIASPQLDVALEIGAAEQTFGVGLGGAVVGTAALALGWHGLAYAMAYVFWPVAAATALATLGIAFWGREKDLERRRRKMREIVYECQKHFVVQIDTGRFSELGGRTLREEVSEKTNELVTATVRAWEKTISGNLTGQHYRMLGAAFTAHLQLIQECLDDLPAPG